VLVALVLALLLKTFLVQAFFIPSESMLPTLEVSDRVLVNKVVFDLREPRRGEVVVFREPGVDAGPDSRSLVQRGLDFLASGLGAPPDERDFIKRIIGLPGETVELRDGVVYIDGRELPESLATEGGYLLARDQSDFGPVAVPEGEYFVMGDNRPNSNDSRASLGTIPSDQLIGRAFVTIWPPGRAGPLSIPGYELGPAPVPVPAS